MFKKTIKFTDFNGKEQEKDFWFHLSNAKLAILAADNSLKIWAEEMQVLRDGPMILEKLREIIKMSCGKRSEDGQRFIQTEEAQSELLDSPAFDELLFELFVGDNASQFFSALVPPEQQKQIEELARKQGIDPLKNPPNPDGPGEAMEDPRPAWEKENRRPTTAELRGLSNEDMLKAWAWAEKFNK